MDSSGTPPQNSASVLSKSTKTPTTATTAYPTASGAPAVLHAASAYPTTGWTAAWASSPSAS